MRNDNIALLPGSLARAQWRIDDPVVAVNPSPWRIGDRAEVSIENPNKLTHAAIAWVNQFKDEWFNRNQRGSVTAMSASHKYTPEQDLRYAGNLQLTITIRNRCVLLEGEPNFAECKFVNASGHPVHLRPPERVSMVGNLNTLLFVQVWSWAPHELV